MARICREPTLLALALTVFALLLLLAVTAVVVFFVASLGFGWFALATVALLLAALLVAPRFEA